MDWISIPARESSCPQTRPPCFTTVLYDGYAAFTDGTTYYPSCSYNSSA
ncbi:hypothetical protein PI125_g3012 [Phytophthora idaei]|nr:hypothetical protein PI125_g3012 [Phytophthora idaei]